MQLELARHPQRLQARHPIIIEELLALAEGGNPRGASMMIKMLKGLHEYGRNSQYLVKLRSSPIWELKPTSRGGETGGARVYLFLLENGGAGIVNCEIKSGNAPNTESLRVVLEVIAAYQLGVPVFEEPVT
ncbi:MAG: hypothetical protein ACYC5V_09310 [Gemmatimonadaceae bacterium]